MAKQTKKQGRKFDSRKAKIKQYTTDVKMAIQALTYEIFLEAGWSQKDAKKISFDAAKEETFYIQKMANDVIASAAQRAAVGAEKLIFPV